MTRPGTMPGQHWPGRWLWALLLLACLGVIPTRCPAQPWTTLHSFSPVSFGTNSDGAGSYATLALSGGTLYGTTFNAGAASNGTVFAINVDGTGFTNLHVFSLRSGLLRTNTDGAQPVGGVVVCGDRLYGTTGAAGGAGRGTVYALNVDGSGFTNLHSFNGNNDGSATVAALVLSGNTLYGAAQSGGQNGCGMLFGLNTDGTGYTNLHNFAAYSNNTNSEGGQPLAAMIVSGNTLYGTTGLGGAGGKGSVFRMNTDGTGFTNLHSFTALVSSTNSDGAQPFGALVLAGDTLFGTTSYGGAAGNGVVFRLNTDGTGFTNLHSFTPLNPNTRTNSDGANPFGGLFLSGTSLYGTAAYGGSLSNGTVFLLNTDGSGFKVLYNFTASISGTNADGAAPVSVILSSNRLFGVTHSGGAGGSGTVFSWFMPPPVSLCLLGTNLVVTWPTNAEGFTLQSTTGLTPAPVWSPITAAPVVINGQNVLTNAMTDPERYYRLVR